MVSIFDADAWLRAGRSRIVQLLIGVAFAAYVLYHWTKFRFGNVFPLSPVGDSSIIFNVAREVFARAAYDPDDLFPYSPSAVLLFRALAATGPAAFMATWYALMVAGIVVTVRAALTQERPDVRAAWPLIGIIAVAFADSPIHWDLRNSNSNLIYLGLVMAGYGLSGRWQGAAGTLVGLSVSVKLYSGLLLGWLLVNGPRRMLYAGALAMAVLWVVLPVAFFGVDGTLRLYAGWKAQVDRIGDLAYHAHLIAQPGGPPLVTLHRAIVSLTGEAFDATRTQFWVWVLRGAWVVALLWYAWRCRQALHAAIPSRAALADWTVLLLAPLPFSPWLEPYHAVPMLVAATLCTTIALDRLNPGRDRLLALTVLGTLGLFLAVRVPFGVRGLGLLTQFLVIAVVLGLMRPRLPRSAG